MKPNALNFFGVREVDFKAPHFEYTHFQQQYNFETALHKWISSNLKGRYYIGKTLVLDRENHYQNNIPVGFEYPQELSYFMLACPHLKY